MMRKILLAAAMIGGFGLAHAAESVAVGQTIKAQFTTADRVSDAGGRSKDYQVSLKKGQLVAFNVRSTAVDPVAILFKADGKLLEENDDHGESTDSLIVTTIPESGNYILRVNSLAGDEETKSVGEFSLRISLVSE